MSKNRLKKSIGITIIILFLIPLSITLFDSNKNENGYQTELNSLSISSEVTNDFIKLIPDINYADLDDAYYNHKIEMIIITPPGQPSFRTAVEPLRDWKNAKGVKTVILSNFTEYGDPTDDNATKIRKMIQEFYEKEEIRWVLLAGDAQDDLIPIRMVYNPDVIDVPDTPSEPVGNDYYKPTDFYYAELTGNWNTDGDSNYGESARYNTQGVDEIDWIPEVYVGRLPANDATELGNMVTKTIKYESNPEIGDWMNKMLLAGVISDTAGQEPPDGEDESRLTEYIWKNYVEPEMNFTHLYKSTYFSVNTSVHSSDRVEEINDALDFRDEINSGYSTVIFAGHGSPSAYSSKSLAFNLYTNTLAALSSNTNMPSLVYADACTTASYDYNDNSIGEELIKRPTSGAIGYIGALRVTWYILDDPDFEYLNRANALLFWKEFFENDVHQQGKTLYDSKMAYMNSPIFEQGITSMYREYHRKNVLTYCLLGDPEVDIYSNTPKSVSNPFTSDIYEGQLVSVIIKDNNSEIVPHARVHLTTADGKYRTVYADKNGVANFRVYPTANETYNVTITGHNLVPTYFNFTTLPDTIKPEIFDVECSNQVATSMTNICFDVNACDNASGIKDTIVLIINSQSGGYFSYLSSNQLEENRTEFHITLNKLEPGEYMMMIASRDFANNTEFHSVSFQFSIPIPISYYILIIASIMISGLAGLSIIVAYSGNKKYSLMYKRMEEL
jgi:hypothetical protein